MEARLDDFISRQEPCLIVVTNTTYRDSTTNNFRHRTQLFFKSERNPKHWAPWSAYRFPEWTAAAKKELQAVLDYRSGTNPNINIEILSERAYEERFPKVRSVYGA